MSYDEAVKAGLGPFIVKPGETVKPLSEISADELQSVQSGILKSMEDVIQKWGYNDIGEPILLEYGKDQK